MAHFKLGHFYVDLPSIDIYFVLPDAVMATSAGKDKTLQDINKFIAINLTMAKDRLVARKRSSAQAMQDDETAEPNYETGDTTLETAEGHNISV